MGQFRKVTDYATAPAAKIKNAPGVSKIAAMPIHRFSEHLR